ncbi:MAG: DUF4982 domain-containing protein [Phycisphaerae bacterium]|nr:DUF4982 domain-containing protein [Phycisphaerae bacterium]
MKKNCFWQIALLGILVVVLAACGVFLSSESWGPDESTQKVESSFQDRPFDSDWRFFRGDAAGAQQPDYDDTSWPVLDLPHDWSIEDLPPADGSIPELEAVTGLWRFRKGDDADWKARQLNDSDWQSVLLPDTWEHHSDHTADNVFGWFRRHLEIPDNCKGKDFDLLLGCIDDVDEVWFNGWRIGGTGSFPPNYQTAWTIQRRYRVPALLVRGDGTDVVAVRVFDGSGSGGIYQAGSKSVRIGPFDPVLSAGGHFTGYTVGGIGWYRKHFTVEQPNKQVSVLFDGVYMNAEVWLNGRRLGGHPHGYTSFEFDLTRCLNAPGQDNVLAVRVRNEGKNSRWYSGSGIYRHVQLLINELIHVPTGGVFITTPEVSADKALVKAAVEVYNAAAVPTQAVVRTELQDADGRLAGRVETALSLSAVQTHSAEICIDVPSPRLWSPETPNLYTAKIEVVTAGKISDAVVVPFGIRTIEFDAHNGFRLNGRTVLLKGANLHHDNGPLGAAAIDRAEERRVELMKANGFNAVRCSHNPPSSAFLEACDRLGMLVIVEAFDQWNEAKENRTEGYQRFFSDWHQQDIASMVRRDRNHPSVIMWSIGNEIPEQFRDEETAKRLRQAVLLHDTTRPVTQAICSDWGKVARSWDELSGLAFKHLDVAGYNYLPDKYESDHVRYPQRVMYGSESFPKEALLYWSLVEEHPYVIGDFVWSGMDYLGEAGLAHAVLSSQPESFFMSWPWFNAWCGDLDICGFKKPQSFYRDVVWRRSPIEIFVHRPIPPGLAEKLSWWAWPDELQSWNWPGQEGRPLQITVYSRCETVRLELNGKVVGQRPVSPTLTAQFRVPYAPGELCALGLISGKVAAKATLKTAGPPKKLRLTADRTSIRASRSDLAYVTVEVVDADGQRVPDAEVLVHFSVMGAGELAAQGSGVPNEPASFKSPQRKTFQGRCLAILRPRGGAGDIVLHAQAEGLDREKITIHTR